MKKMNFAQARAAMLTSWKAGLVPNLIGPVGDGKTALVKAVHAEIRLDMPEFKLWQFLTSTVQSVDVGGYPKPPEGDQKTVQYVPPSYLPYILGDAERDGECGILFCDEVDRATIETLNALTQLFHGGQIHDFRLRAGVKIVCAMNGETDIGTTVLPTAIKTRLVNIYLDETIKPDWYKTQGWDVSELLPLLKTKPCHMTESMGELNKRTLEFSLRFIDAANTLAASPDWEHDDAVVSACIAGLVGEENAEAIIMHQSLPSVRQITENPLGCRIPSQPSHRMALADRCNSAFGTLRGTAKENIVIYASRLGKELFAAKSYTGMVKAIDNSGRK